MVRLLVGPGMERTLGSQAAGAALGKEQKLRASEQESLPVVGSRAGHENRACNNRACNNQACTKLPLLLRGGVGWGIPSSQPSLKSKGLEFQNRMMGLLASQVPSQDLRPLVNSGWGQQPSPPS